MRADGILYGRANAGVVYVNLSKQLTLKDARNNCLKELGDDLELLTKNLGGLDERAIKGEISEIVGNNKDFFQN